MSKFNTNKKHLYDHCYEKLNNAIWSTRYYVDIVEFDCESLELLTLEEIKDVFERLKKNVKEDLQITIYFSRISDGYRIHIKYSLFAFCCSTM